MTPCTYQMLGLIIFAIYIYCIMQRPDVRWKMAKKAKGGGRSSDIDALRVDMIKDEMAKIAALVSRDPPDDTKDSIGVVLRDKIYRAIEYAIKRHDWYEDQRSRIFGVILAVATLTIAILGWSFKNTGSVHVVFWPLILNMIFSVAFAVYYYNEELDGDRSYQLVSDIRFWFFRYNFKTPAEFSEKPNDSLARAALVKFERDVFMKRVLGDFSVVGSMREDLEQLFILHLLQRSKTKSLSVLRWLMSCSLVALMFHIVLYLMAN